MPEVREDRPRLIFWLQVAGFIATACVVWNTWRSLPRWVVPLWAAVCCAAITLGLMLAARVARAPAAGMALRAAAAGAWLGPAIVLLFGLSPLVLVPALALAATATGVLFRLWRRGHPQPAPDRHFRPALSVSILLQTGAVALAMDYRFLAAALFAIMTIRFTALLISAGQLRETNNPARSIANAILAVFLAGGFILGGTMFSRRNTRGGSAQAPAGNRPVPVRQPGGPAAPGEVPGGFSGVVLWPEVKPVAMLVEPLPLSDRLAGRSPSHPLVIPFDGEYWMFRWPYMRPPPWSYFRRGNPAELSFSTVDHAHMQMEAHQKLERSLDLRCCGRIQIEITNRDQSSGGIALELLVVDNSAPGPPEQTLGNAMVPASGDVSSQTLNFKVPPAPLVTRFDEFKVIFRRVRSDHSARISIERFVLTPRGM